MRLISRFHADVAQLVEHHLAKVRVAGSNPVVRSKQMRRSESLNGLARGLPKWRHQWEQCRAKGKWANCLLGEHTYIVLSSLAKSLLVRQIFASTLAAKG